MYIEYHQLSKTDKKIVRALLDKGKAAEFKWGMQSFDTVLQAWRNEADNHQDNYYKIFNAVRDFDKQIARRYDGMTGSKFLLVLAGQVYDKFIDEAELEPLSPEVRDFILRIVRINQ
jgi:hypothetical protein